MIKKVILYLFLLPAVSLFMTCGGDSSSDDETEDVTRLRVTLRYDGDKIAADSWIGIALNREDELVNTGGYFLPDPSVYPCSVEMQSDPVKGTTYTVTMPPIPVAEAYIFVFLNVDGKGMSPASGDPYIFYDNKSGQATVSEADLVIFAEGEDNAVTVTFDDTYFYP